VHICSHVTNSGLSITRTNTQLHTQTLSYTHKPSVTLTLSYTHKHSVTLTNIQLHSQTLSYTHKHSVTLTNTQLHSQTFSYTHKHSVTLTNTQFPVSNAARLTHPARMYKQHLPPRTTKFRTHTDEGLGFLRRHHFKKNYV